ncbi:MAG: hypothetical protein M1828_006114 [Chrysothrix sp. TS-e1954]|nr:MAG: hypothetical protein M1828_006114 [Chrysothrix sp. TS-e1954]
MESFTFLVNSQAGSGRVHDEKAKRTIRAQAMRHTWARRCEESVIDKAEDRNVVKPFAWQVRKGHTGVLEKAKARTMPEQRQGQCKFASQERPVKVPKQFGTNADRFTYAGTCMDAKACAYFQHYASEFQMILCDDLLPSAPQSSPLCCSTAVLENSQALLHGICYIAAAHEAIQQARPSSFQDFIWGGSFKTPAHKDFLQYKSRSLKHLSDSLTQSTTDTLKITEATILCVALHLTGEAIANDKLACQAHLSGLSRAVELHGGEESLSPAAMTLVRIADLKAAALERRRPIFDYPSNVADCTGTFSGHTGDPLNLLTTGNPLAGQVNQKLAECFCYAARLNSSSVLSDVDETGTLSHENIDAFVALEHSLLSLPSDHMLTSLENCARLALMLHSNINLFKIPTFFGWVIALTADLKSALMTLDWTKCLEKQASLLLWILMLGAQSARAQDDTERMWWTVKLIDIATHLDVWSLEEVKQVTASIIPIGRACDDAWDDLMFHDQNHVKPAASSQATPCKCDGRMMKSRSRDMLHPPPSAPAAILAAEG